MMRSPRVLVIDGDHAVRTLLRRTLTEAGYRVDEAPASRGALHKATEHNLDLVILGIDSAESQGIAGVRIVRDGSPIPIIALSNRDDEDTVIEALTGGADDFIRMPFNVRETVARVENVLRRRARERGKPAQFLIGDLQVDLLHRRVSFGGRDIHLSAKTFEVLRLLAEARGRTLTHREIVRRVWGASRQHRTQYLRVAIAKLRRRIEPDPLRPAYIITEPGIGYRLQRPVN